MSAPVLDSLRNNFTCSNDSPAERFDGPGARGGLFSARQGCGGTEYRVMYCANCGHEIRIPVGCGDRTCPACRYQQFLRLRRRYLPLVSQCEVPRLALVTLTLRLDTDDAGLDEKVKRIRECWGRLIRLAAWRPVTGGLAVIECKWSSRYAGAWNVHIHALCEVGQVVRPFRFWAKGQREGFRGRVFKREKIRRLGADLIGAGGRVLTPQGLSEAWRRLTGDSYVVDVQPVRKLADGRGGPKGALCYILKYMTKDLGFPTQAARDAYNRAMTIQREDADGRRHRAGRRVVMTFGTWHPTSKHYRFARRETAPTPCRECQECAGWLGPWDLVRMGQAAAAGWSVPLGRDRPAPVERVTLWDVAADG